MVQLGNHKKDDRYIVAMINNMSKADEMCDNLCARILKYIPTVPRKRGIHLFVEVAQLGVRVFCFILFYLFVESLLFNCFGSDWYSTKMYMLLLLFILFKEHWRSSYRPEERSETGGRRTMAR